MAQGLDPFEGCETPEDYLRVCKEIRGDTEPNPFASTIASIDEFQRAIALLYEASRELQYHVIENDPDGTVIRNRVYYYD